MIRNVAALTQRELATNFLSPVAYVVAAVFLVATGHLFMGSTLVEGEEASPADETEAAAVQGASPHETEGAGPAETSGAPEDTTLSHDEGGSSDEAIRDRETSS